MSACAAIAAHAELAERERNIVGDDDDVVGGNFIEPRRLAHSLAGEVHVGLRHHQKHIRPAKFDDLRQRAEAQAVAAKIALVDQTLRGHEADVVAGVFVLLAVVAQTDEQPFRRAGFFENHENVPHFLRP